MSDTLPPRRSVLYVPANNKRTLEKARILPADCLIFDLEDAIPPTAKVEARQNIVSLLQEQEGGYKKHEIIVRINGLDTPWGLDDIQAVSRLSINQILLPKIESVQQVHANVNALNNAQWADEIGLWLMIETIAGVLHSQEIAAADPRITALVVGTSDLAKAMRVRHTADRIGLLSALSQCVLVARHYELDTIDGVHLHLEDENSFRLSCEQGRDMGFDGKSLIHPKQIELANRIFSPSGAEINHAQAVVTAWQQAQSEGKGVVVVNGKLVENLHVDEAKRTLALAHIIRSKNSESL